ncbi:MAG: DUF2314 domain-containing protein [Luteolibacter sp.]
MSDSQQESSYPYPQLEIHGYELEVVEQKDIAEHPFLRHPIPSDEERYSAKSGDLVKLVFRYRDSVSRNGNIVSAEHMWVEVTHCAVNCLVGKLDSTPQFTSILEADDEVNFHPKHIVGFWSE